MILPVEFVPMIVMCFGNSSSLVGIDGGGAGAVELLSKLEISLTLAPLLMDCEEVKSDEKSLCIVMFFCLLFAFFV